MEHARIPCLSWFDVISILLLKYPDEMVISSNKYEVINTMVSSFESRMVLTVRKLTAADVGGYRCVAKNSLGEVDSVIRLYEIPGPTATNTSPANKIEEFKYSTPIEGPDNQFGSADSSDDEDDRETTDLPDRTQNIPTTQTTPNKNKSSNHISINSVDKDKFSNKVRKMMNKFELDESEFGASRCSKLYSISNLVYVLMIVVSVFVHSFVGIDFT